MKKSGKRQEEQGSGWMEWMAAFIKGSVLALTAVLLLLLACSGAVSGGWLSQKDMERCVVAVCGPEPFIEIVTHDPESDEWQDLDASGCEQHNMKEPDYWIDLPDHDEY